MPETTTDGTPTYFWDNYRDTTMDRYLLQLEHSFIDQFLNGSQRPRTLLDIGCGSGRVSLPLCDGRLSVVGLDIDPTALAAFRQDSANASLVRGNALRLPFTNQSLDCVTAIQCFQSFENHHPFLRECHRVLREGGVLIFQSLNRHNYKRMLRRLAGRSDPGGPSGNLSCRDVLRATTEHGFDILEVMGYNWVPFDRRSDSSLVNLAATLERTLKLYRYHTISPWILIAATKRSTNAYRQD